ncbi:MAG: SAM-dependent methyltransferase, partial [Rhodocyclaceae bacterium]|nr:SAM-dependent methyltransferase [Rhodocyclaceae bacterium]
MGTAHSVALLQALHILTVDGRINQDSRRKLKQVEHLLQFICPMLDELQPHGGEVALADCGAGKSYLGFLLYERWFAPHGTGSVYAIERRAELAQGARALAEKQGYARMHFIAGDVEQAAALPEKLDMVCALHACDTATDEAIALALARRAQAIALVPCCQAEVAAALRLGKAQALSAGALAELWRHPLHTREFGSHLTNVLRCLYLQASGYSVSVTELTGWEHSLKNELICARGTGTKAAAPPRVCRRSWRCAGCRRWLRGAGRTWCRRACCTAPIIRPFLRQVPRAPRSGGG